MRGTVDLPTTREMHPTMVNAPHATPVMDIFEQIRIASTPPPPPPVPPTMTVAQFSDRVYALWLETGASPEIAHARADEAAGTYARDQRAREPTHRRIVRLAAQMVHVEGDVLAARVAAYVKHAGITEEDMPASDFDWLALGAALGNAWSQLDEKQHAAVDAGAPWGAVPEEPKANAALCPTCAPKPLSSWPMPAAFVPTGVPMIDGVHAIIPQGANGVGFIGGQPLHPEPPFCAPPVNPVPAVAPPSPSPAAAPVAITGASNLIPGPCPPAPPPVPAGMGPTRGEWGTPTLNHVPDVAVPSTPSAPLPPSFAFPFVAPVEHSTPIPGAGADGLILEPDDPVFKHARSIVGRENPVPEVEPAASPPAPDQVAVDHLRDKLAREFEAAYPGATLNVLALARIGDAVRFAAVNLAGGATSTVVNVPFLALVDDEPLHLARTVTPVDFLPPPPPLADQVRETVRAAQEKQRAELAAREAKVTEFRAVLDAIAEGISTDRVTAKWLVQGSRQDLLFHPHGVTTTRHATHVTVTHDGVLVQGRWLETVETIVAHFKSLCSSIDFLEDLREAEALAAEPTLREALREVIRKVEGASDPPTDAP